MMASAERLLSSGAGRACCCCDGLAATAAEAAGAGRGWLLPEAGLPTPGKLGLHDDTHFRVSPILMDWAPSTPSIEPL